MALSSVAHRLGSSNPILLQGIYRYRMVNDTGIVLLKHSCDDMFGLTVSKEADQELVPMLGLVSVLIVSALQDGVNGTVCFMPQPSIAGFTIDTRSRVFA